MKYLISFVIGLLLGAAALVVALYFNPFLAKPGISPLAVSDDRVFELSYSAVPADTLLYTNDGNSNIRPHPDRVAELWEPAVADTTATVTMLEDARGNVAGLGIKFMSASESTSLLDGQAIANSVWHVYLPREGTFMIDQTENYWTYLRDVVIPARWNSADSWRGTYRELMTNGPGSLGTARLVGGSGRFEGLVSESVESLTARAYSASAGPVSVVGSLAIAIPQEFVAGQ